MIWRALRAWWLQSIGARKGCDSRDGISSPLQGTTAARVVTESEVCPPPPELPELAVSRHHHGRPNRDRVRDGYRSGPMRVRIAVSGDTTGRVRAMAVSVSRRARSHALSRQRWAISLGRQEYEQRFPDRSFSPVVALICAYEEEANIGDVLARIPTKACGMEVTPLVVVDGGEDATDRIAIGAGALTFVSPANLGHGVALRVGYDLCIAKGAQFVVTLDADGQNDPSEMEAILQPVVDDEADFVVASRRLGMDETADRYRRAGVVVFAWLMNRLMGTTLTDTSNGYRAFKVSMISDVLPRLKQDQYQTAELLIIAMSHGWRVIQCPAVWHERESGKSKKGSNFIYGLHYGWVILRTWQRERLSR